MKDLYTKNKFQNFSVKVSLSSEIFIQFLIEPNLLNAECEIGDLYNIY